MNTKPVKNIFSAMALGVASTLSASVFAGDVNETVVQGHALPAVSVSFNPLELATLEGFAAIERRIERAAEQVCGSLNIREVGSLSRLARNKECYDSAIAQAMGQLDIRRVASVD